MRYDCRVRLFVLMYTINSLESSRRIATVVSKLKAGIVPLRTLRSHFGSNRKSLCFCLFVILAQKYMSFKSPSLVPSLLEDSQVRAVDML